MATDQQVGEFQALLMRLDHQGALEMLKRLADPRDGLLGVEALVSQALERIGQEWEGATASLAQVYMTAKMCQDVLLPWMPPDPPASSGAVALVVLEDRHLLGASLVRSVLACAGRAPAWWGSLDTAETVARAIQHRPATLLVSTLMLRAALKVRQLTRALREAGLSTRVIVGGAPFRLDPVLWQEVGADAMGRNAADAVELTREIVRGVA